MLFMRAWGYCAQDVGCLGIRGKVVNNFERRKNEARMDVEEVRRRKRLKRSMLSKEINGKAVRRNRRQRFPYELQNFNKVDQDSRSRGGGRASKVEYNNKENLQPGIQQDRPGCFDAMDMEKVQSWGKEEDPNASADLGSIKEFTTPVLNTYLMMLNILVWNVRGAASRGIAAAIRNLKKQYNLDVIVILEPRISGNRAKKCIKSWGFNQSCRMEAEEFSGGIWIVWERADLIVDTLVKDQHFIHCRLILGSESMTFSAVYASPTENRRSRTWEDLYKISCDTSDPWLIAGDFNEIKSPLEQKGGGRINETRCLCNAQWQERCNKADVRVVPRIGSDHHPIVIRLEEEVN
ncbi:hypothetical protein K1719_044600 [Acacia pycnantha]|nr:hypothetical protein K1719_044600 [Acacia pycnantha]